MAFNNSVKENTSDKKVSNNNLFKGVANCDISINLNVFEQIRAFNKKRLVEINEINGTNLTALPASATLANFTRGNKIQFGDEVEFNEQGYITVYPKSVFENYNARSIELPTPVSGRLDEVFKNLGGLPEDQRRDIELKNKQLATNRFVTLPLISKCD